MWAGRLRKGAVWLPHNKIANSPGNPAWDLTGGKFGVYQNQVFMGDQTLSQLFRVVTERVNGVDQGCAILFAEGLASGPMRPCFLADGSMMLGQTGRGWYATGGFAHALQRMVWDGETIPGDILRVASNPDGFEIHFTRPLKRAGVANSVQVKSWFYTNTVEYGSPEHDDREDAVAATELSGDGLVLLVKLKDFGKGDFWLDRIYEITLPDTAESFGEQSAWSKLQAYFTLRAIPE
jgi:hypothetical protein